MQGTAGKIRQRVLEESNVPPETDRIEKSLNEPGRWDIEGPLKSRGTPPGLQFPADINVGTDPFDGGEIQTHGTPHFGDSQPQNR